MYFDEEAYAEGICNSAAGSTIEVFVDTIDGTVGSLRELVQKLPNNEEAREYVFEHIKRWEALRKAIVAIEQSNDELTAFARTREEVKAELEALAPDEEWEDADTGKTVIKQRDALNSVDGWAVWDDGDRYNFYSIEDVLDEIGV